MYNTPATTTTTSTTTATPTKEEEEDDEEEELDLLHLTHNFSQLNPSLNHSFSLSNLPSLNHSFISYKYPNSNANRFQGSSVSMNSVPPLPYLNSSSNSNKNSQYIVTSPNVPHYNPINGLARSVSAIHVPNTTSTLNPLSTRSPPHNSHYLHPGSASPPQLDPIINDQCMNSLDISAILWDTLSATSHQDPSNSGLNLFTRDFHHVMSLYRQANPTAGTNSSCLLTVAVSNTTASQLKLLCPLVPPHAQFIDSTNLTLVTELLRLVLSGVRQLTIISNCLAIHQAIKHISETQIIHVHWVTSLPTHVLASTNLTSVQFSNLDEFMATHHQLMLQRTYSASHVQFPHSIVHPNLNVQSPAHSPPNLRASHSALNLSTRLTESPTLHSATSPYKYSPATSIHPHPPNIVKSVPVRPPPDPDHIPLKHVSFGPLFHALHHPAIRDRLGPQYTNPIDLSLLGGILKQAMDPFSSLKLYLQAAVECGLLRLGHVGSRCLLRITNPVWLAYWQPFSKDSVLMPNVISPTPPLSSSSEFNTDPPVPSHVRPSDIHQFVPLLHAFCIARMRYPVPIRTPAIGPLLKPMFARGDLAPFRKLSEYLAEAQKGGVITLTRLGVNGDVEVSVREQACGEVWAAIRARYGPFRDPDPLYTEIPFYPPPAAIHTYPMPPQQQLIYPVTHPFAYYPPPVTAASHLPPPSNTLSHPANQNLNQLPNIGSSPGVMLTTTEPKSKPTVRPVSTHLVVGCSSSEDDDDDDADFGLTFIARTSAQTSPLPPEPSDPLCAKRTACNPVHLDMSSEHIGEGSSPHSAAE